MKNREYYKRVFCFFMIIILLSEVIFPTAALAVTSGADAPEAQSFEPVGTTEMVDLFTGDFNYNIPLITVPGPNGGYPVNLAYHAGISPEQEASWVGLGWNLNVGSVNRNMRGLPDDFYGSDIVKKSFTMKPHWTFGVDLKADVEVFSFSASEAVPFSSTLTLGATQGIYYNNYKGLGQRRNIKLDNESKMECLQYKGKEYNIGVNSSIEYVNDTQGEADLKISTKISYEEDAADTKDKSPTTDADASKNPNAFKAMWQKIKPAYDKVNGIVKTHKENVTKYEKALKDHSSGISFANPSFIPSNSFPEGGFDASLWVKFGGEVYGTFINGAVKGYLFMQHVKDKTLDYPTYGYLHLGERSRMNTATGASPYLNYPGAPAVNGQIREGMALMDFNRYNDNSININAPNLAVPALTYDIFSASGQGMGMVFRPHRSDIGMVYDPRTTSDFTDAQLGFELGVAAGIKLGVNPGISYTNSYDGKWKGQYPDFFQEYEFTNSHYKMNDLMSDDATNVFSEPFYFKSADDKAISGLEDGKFRTDELFNFEITSVGDAMSALASIPAGDFDPANYTLQVFPKIKNQMAGFSTIQPLQYNKDFSPHTRSNSIEYKTRWEITNTLSGGLPSPKPTLYGINQFPYLTSSPNTKLVDYSLTADKKGHHIGQFSVVNSEGNTYVYALPVYNLKQKDVAFSIPDNTTNDRVINYTVAHASLANQEGSDNFYASTETPGYASNYLLTSVFSSDYVDVTGDGPSEDDLGYYVKFNYSPITKEPGLNTVSGYYKWRYPFSGAIKAENFEDHAGDDKAGYVYGEKEVYYLNSIQTKTHFAAFELSDESPAGARKDGYGATSENDNSSPNPDLSIKPRHLNKIKLYSINNLTTPIKTVHFEYDYSLCPNTVNSIAPGGGKLTLKKVFFTYQDNNAGSLSPYQFTYGFNPSYKQMLSDVWGTYKEDKSVSTAYNYYGQDFPFVDQNKTSADAFSSAWSMTKIKLPSGGTINVQYESDDYKYVQNKLAMQLNEITRIGYDNGGGSFTDAFFNLDREPSFGDLHNLVEFKLTNPTTDLSELQNYIKEVNKLYFKTYLKLKKLDDLSGDVAYDYVDGYCEIDKTFGVRPIVDPTYIVGGKWTRAYIKVKFVKALKVDVADDGKLHPFRKAGFEYMKSRRPELFYPVNGSSSNTSNSYTSLGVQALYNVASLFTGGFGQALFNYNRWCKIRKFCNEVAHGSNPSENDDKPSYIRLNSPLGTKYGGGHRVSKLYIDDNWNIAGNPNVVNTYGREYTYQLYDKTSSGVAEYEPVFGGGAENPLKQPNDAHMSERPFTANLKELYQETPITEGYFPSASVGYSRILVKSLRRADINDVELNTLSADGVTVNEYFTAKDFPVDEKVTPADNTKFDKSLTIPFIGRISLKSSGFSQGYKVILNDMHGKPKAIKVYPHNADLFTTAIQDPIHEVSYVYNLGASGQLNNAVSVLVNDGQVEKREIGVDRDFVMDMDQTSAYTISAGACINADITFIPPSLIPNVLLSLNYAHNTKRSFVNVKSIYRQGILIETVVKNDKAITSTKNLLFDSQTGRPLLTVVNNEFNAPVYNYDIPAHWYYKNMGNRSAYYKYSTGITVSGSNITLDQPTYFDVGDKVKLYSSVNLTVNYQDCWIKTKSSTGVITVMDYKGLAVPLSGYDAIQLIDPIKKNHLDIDAGNIVSLTDPVTNNNSAFLINFNGFLQFTRPKADQNVKFTFSDCITGSSITGNFFYNSTTNTFLFSWGGCRGVTIQLPSFVTGSNFLNYIYYKPGNSTILQVRDPLTNNVLGNGTWSDPGACVANCLDGVLHAESYVFEDTWFYDYNDHGNPTAYGTTLLSTAANNNPYRYGRTGTWRVKENYLYQVERKQTSPHTDIAKDGTYRVFNWYNWYSQGTSGSNGRWTMADKVNQYSPYGFEIETADVNGDQSSKLYGHKNSVPIATGLGIPYDQLASQSFEEFSGTPSSIKNGHFNLRLSSFGPMNIYTPDRHTGKNALKLTGTGLSKILQVGDIWSTTGTTTGGVYHVVPSVTPIRKYIFSYWFKNIAGTSVPNIVLPGGATLVSNTVTQEKIDGWQKMDVVFYFTATQVSPGTLNIDASAISNDVYIDDLRLQPFEGILTAFVYDNSTLWMLGQLDERNYATFYNYDESGNLVQVKKETSKGIVTVSNFRKNISR
jgi:hypothetical protein